MKHIKTYENILDEILDKISKKGMDSLTPAERKYLKNVYKEDVKNLEDELEYKYKFIRGIFNYDPRRDEYFKNTEFNFDKFNDEEIEDGRYAIIWNEIDEEDIEHFIDYFNIKDHSKYYKGKKVYKPWDELSSDTKDKFKKYINKFYLKT